MFQEVWTNNFVIHNDTSIILQIGKIKINLNKINKIN